MQKMTKIGDPARCPQCGGTAHVVWISQDEKTMAIKCARYHSQLNALPQGSVHMPRVRRRKEWHSL